VRSCRGRMLPHADMGRTPYPLSVALLVSAPVLCSQPQTTPKARPSPATGRERVHQKRVNDHPRNVLEISRR